MKAKIRTFVIFVLVFMSFSCSRKSNVEREAAIVRQKEYRSVTVINQAFDYGAKSCTITTGSGVEVAHKNEVSDRNIVFMNVDESNAFENESAFLVYMKDKYGLTYIKQFEMAARGNTDVTVTQDDYVPMKGDWKRKLDRKFN